MTSTFTEARRRRHARDEVVHCRDEATEDEGLQGGTGPGDHGCHGCNALEYVVDVRPIPEDPLTRWSVVYCGTSLLLGGKSHLVSLKCPDFLGQLGDWLWIRGIAVQFQALDRFLVGCRVERHDLVDEPGTYNMQRRETGEDKRVSY